MSRYLALLIAIAVPIASISPLVVADAQAKSKKKSKKNKKKASSGAKKKSPKRKRSLPKPQPAPVVVPSPTPSIVTTRPYGPAWRWPVSEPVVGCVLRDANYPKGGINREHTGLDLPMAGGTPVVSPVEGRVVFDNTRESGRRAATAVVVIKSVDGHDHILGHIKSSYSGVQVSPGTPIGQIWSDGSIGAHLHWGVNVYPKKTPNSKTFETGLYNADGTTNTHFNSTVKGWGQAPLATTLDTILTTYQFIDPRDNVEKPQNYTKIACPER